MIRKKLGKGRWDFFVLFTAAAAAKSLQSCPTPVSLLLLMFEIFH